MPLRNATKDPPDKRNPRHAIEIDFTSSPPLLRRSHREISLLSVAGIDISPPDGPMYPVEADAGRDKRSSCRSAVQYSLIPQQD